MSLGVYRPTDPGEINNRREMMRLFLVKMTKEACQELNTTGLGFVLSTITFWAHEFDDRDMQKQAAKYLRAVADTIDPSVSENQKRASELKRRKAFDQLSELANRPGFFDVQDERDPQP